MRSFQGRCNAEREDLVTGIVMVSSLVTRSAKVSR